MSIIVRVLGYSVFTTRVGLLKGRVGLFIVRADEGKGWVLIIRGWLHIVSVELLSKGFVTQSKGWVTYGKGWVTYIKGWVTHSKRFGNS